MKKVYFFTLTLLISALSLFAQATKDEQYFKLANEALLTKDCNTALLNLQLLSLDGKDDARYARMMGEMHECKGNKEQAVFFYRKYLAQHPNDTIQFKVNYLEAGVEKHGGANDKRNLKYHSTNRRYSLFNAGFVKVIGNKYEASYRSGWKITLNRGYPIFHKHATLEFGASTGALTRANKEWFADALYTTPDRITKMGNAFAPGLDLTLMPVWYKNKKLSVAAGVTAGINMYLTFNSEFSGGASYNDNNLSWASPTLGIKARFYYKHVFTAFAEYNKITRKYLDVTTAYNEYNAVPIKMSLISIGIGVYTSFGG